MIMKVSILGRDYNIKTEDDEEYVQKVSRYINEKAQNISKNTGNAYRFGKKVQVNINL